MDAWPPNLRKTSMKIEDHIFEQMCDRGEHYPVTPHMIRFNLPSIEDFRKIVPPLMSSEDLEWIYLRHFDHGRDTSPQWRTRLMYYINHFVKLRTEPDFISSEAAICHLSNNNLQKRRWKVIREMELAACGTSDETDFAEWYTNKGNKVYGRKWYNPISHTRASLVSKDSKGWYPTHHDEGYRFHCKRHALRHAKSKSLGRFLELLERVL